MNSRSFYLSTHGICRFTCVFTATFSDNACVKDCFIIANSLKEAINIIYSQLPNVSDLSTSVIDSCLLSVEFDHRLRELPF